jgi:hypothetical protein
MKNCITILFCLIYSNSFSQNVIPNKSLDPFFNKRITPIFLVEGLSVPAPPTELMVKVQKQFKEKNINRSEATINDWEKVLREVGTVIRRDNTLLSCSISEKNYANFSFINNYLTSFCEYFDDGKPTKK